jgi:hypothetical protein
MDAERRLSIERWFASRGVPQLIEGFSSEQRMDARTGPFIAIWIVAGTYILWARRADASLTDNVVAGTIALVASPLAIGALLWARRHIPFDLLHRAGAE